MGLLGDILLAPITGPARGFVAVLESIRDQANAQMPSQESLRDELVSLNSRFEDGALSEEEFTAREADLIEQLKELRAEEEAEAAEEEAEEAEEVDPDSTAAEEDAP